MKIKEISFRKYYFIIILILAFAKPVTSQNLILNPSFEDTTKCYEPAYGLGPYDGIKHWKTGNVTSTWNNNANFFSLDCPRDGQGNLKYPYTCFIGYQLPRTGKVILAQRLADFQWAVTTDWVVYLQSNIAVTLTAGVKYFVGWNTSKQEEDIIACKNYGAYLSADTLGGYYDSAVIKLNPQVFPKTVITDTLNWTMVADTITATGIEQYITIGRFSDFSPSDTIRIPCNYLTACGTLPGIGYYIDDVFVIPLDSLSTNTYGLKDGLQYDNAYCTNTYTTVSVKESFPLLKYWWYNSIMQVVDSLNPSIHPVLTQNATYYLKRQNPAGVIRWDTAYVNIITAGCLTTIEAYVKSNLLIYPNPAKENFYLMMDESEFNKVKEMKLYSVDGRLQKQLALKKEQEVSELAYGIYFLTIKLKDRSLFNIKIVVQH